MVKDATSTVGTIAARSTAGPAVASSITYTVRMNTANGIQEVVGTRPANRSWAEVYGFQVMALPIGHSVDVYTVDRKVKWYADELPAVFNCDGTPVVPGPGGDDPGGPGGPGGITGASIGGAGDPGRIGGGGEEGGI